MFIRFLVTFLLFATVSAYAHTKCPGTAAKGQTVRTAIPYRGVVVYHAPLGAGASKELVDRVMGEVYEVGDTSPVATPPTKALTERIARQVAAELKICVRKVT